MDKHRLEQKWQEIESKKIEEGEYALTEEEKLFLRLLDKVGEQGIESLKPEEKRFLEVFSSPEREPAAFHQAKQKALKRQEKDSFWKDIIYVTV
ncbi:MAG: hypothetical protein D6785_13830, partial [Planctomycetota bacterium]